MPSLQIYPGANRTFLETGDAYTVFNEASLGHLANFGLDKYLTDPAAVNELSKELTPDKAFPGIKHFDAPRAYLLEGDNGNRCVVKPFPDYYSSDSGLRHLATQELLYDALQDVKGYNAARVFGHISLSKSNSKGYALVEYIDAFTYRQIEGPINRTSFVTRAVSQAVVYVQHHKRRKEMLPPNTSLDMYTDLLKGAHAARDKALADFGLSLPRIIPEGPYKGCTNWDFNTENLLCAVDEGGNPELTIIDQGADLTSLGLFKLSP